MIVSHLKRGAIAGAVAGIGYGLFITLVARPFIAVAESFETGAQAPEELSLAVTDVTSIAAGVLWGLLFGVVVFGILYYFFEPALPGARDTRSYLLAAGGFITISGAPWLLFPPQPPGVEQALPTRTRLLWYGGMMVAGAILCGGAFYLYPRLADRAGPAAGIIGSVLVLGLLVLPVVLAPPNPTQSPLPPALESAFRWTMVAGQVGLWGVLASTHAWLIRRSTESLPDEILSPEQDVSATIDS